MRLLVPLAFLVGLFCTRPFRLGVDWTAIGCGLMLAAGVAAAMAGGRRSILVNGLILVAVIAGLWAYLAFHALLMGGPGGRAAVTAFLTNVSAALAAALFFSNPSYADRAFKLLIVFTAASGLSFVVTMGLHVVGFSTASLRWASIRVTDPFYARFGDILFPFTQVYNYATYGGFAVPRAALGLREAGIAQAFIGWVMIAALYRFPMRGWRLNCALLACGVALLSTQSTALVVTLLIFAGVWLIRSPMRASTRILAGALGIGLSAWGLHYWLNDQMFGFAAKSDTASLSDRTFAVFNGLDLLVDHPFGIGLYNSHTANSGINLVAQLHQIGVIGAAMLIAVLIVAHLVRKRVGGTLMPYSVIVATMLTTQPLLDAPAFFVLLFFLLRTPVPPLLNRQRKDQLSWTPGIVARHRVELPR